MLTLALEECSEKAPHNTEAASYLLWFCCNSILKTICIISLMVHKAMSLKKSSELNLS